MKRRMGKVTRKQGCNGNVVGKVAWTGDPSVARSMFPSCCEHPLWGRGGRERRGGGRTRRGENWEIQPPGAAARPLCPGGWALGTPAASEGLAAAGRGAARRGRAAGGAVRGAAPERTGPAEERAPGRARRRFPEPGRPPSSPLVGPWRLTVSALRPRRPGVGGGRGVQGGKFSAFRRCLCAGSREQRPGPSPLITLGCLAGLERAGGPGGAPREGCGRRACARRRGGGDPQCRVAAGPAIAALRGHCPQAQSQPSASRANEGTARFWRCEFKVRLEFWVGFVRLPSGDQDGWQGSAALWPTGCIRSGQHKAGWRPHLVTMVSGWEECLETSG